MNRAVTESGPRAQPRRGQRPPSHQSRTTNMTPDIEPIDPHPIAAPSALAATPSSTDRELRLHTAAELGNVAAIGTLINAGVHPDTVNDAGNSAALRRLARTHGRHRSTSHSSGRRPPCPQRLRGRPPRQSRSGSAIANPPSSPAARAPEPCRSRPPSVFTRRYPGRDS